MATKLEEKKIANQVFLQLQRLGPLCPSQISAQLGLSITKVRSALEILWKQGLAENSRHPTYFSDGVEFNSRDAWKIKFRSKKVRQQRLKYLAESARKEKAVGA